MHACIMPYGNKVVAAMFMCYAHTGNTLEGSDTCFQSSPSSWITIYECQAMAAFAMIYHTTGCQQGCSMAGQQYVIVTSMHAWCNVLCCENNPSNLLAASTNVKARLSLALYVLLESSARMALANPLLKKSSPPARSQPVMFPPLFASKQKSAGQVDKQDT